MELGVDQKDPYAPRGDVCIVELGVDEKDPYASKGVMHVLWSWVLMTRTPIYPLEVLRMHCGAGC